MAEQKTLEVVVRLRDQITRRLGAIRSSIQRFSSRIGNAIKAATRRVAGLTVAFATLGATLAARSFIRAASAVEQFQVQLEALFGSAEKAKAVLTSIREFAARTPLETQDVVASFVNLTAVGLKNARKAVETLGNVAILFNRNIRDVTSGFIGAEAEVLRRLGVTLSRAGNLATIASGDIVLKVKNDTKAIQQGLLEIFERRFPNAMENAAETMKSQFSILKSELFEISAGVGESLGGPIVDALKRINAFLNKNRDVIVQTIIKIPKILSTVLGSIRSTASSAFAVIRGQASENGELIIAALNEVLLRASRVVVVGAELVVVKISRAIVAGFQKIPGAIATLFTSTAFLNAFSPIGAAIIGAVADALNKSIELVNRFTSFVSFGALPAIEFRFKTSEQIMADTLALLARLNNEGVPQLAEFDQEIERLVASLNKLADTTGIPEKLKGIADGIKKAAAAAKQAREQAAKSADEFLSRRASAAGGKENEPNNVPKNIAQAFSLGIEEGLKKWKTGLESLRDSVAKTVANIRTLMVEGLADGITEAINGVTSLSDAFKAMFEQIIRSLQRLAIEAAAAAIFDRLISPLIGIFSSAIGGAIGGAFGAGGAAAPKVPAGGIPRPIGPIVTAAFHPPGGGVSAALSSNRPIEINFNVQAIDAQSFRGALVRDRSTIVGIVREGVSNSPAARKQFAAA